MNNITLVKTNPSYKGLAIALDLLHTQEPFNNWSAHSLISTVKGAVRRGHYILAKEEEKYVGVACWGLCSAEVAEAYLTGKSQPKYQDCIDGDTFLLFIIQANQSAHLKSIVRFMKETYPDHQVYGKRFRKNKSGLTPVILKNR